MSGNSQQAARPSATGAKIQAEKPDRSKELSKVVEQLVHAPEQRSAEDTLPRCSLCGVPFQREQTRVFPFCSTRCQQIDLGHWFNEKFGLPVEGHEDRQAPDAADDDTWE
jgi:endogenous inhibitor of DNA gyrase (YacG/DUF329 family)